VLADVARGDFQRCRGNVARVDLRLWIGACSKNRQAPRAGAQVENAPRPDAKVLEEERDVRPRNDHAAVHVEAQAVQPRLVEQVGGRNALPYSFLDQRLDPPRIGVLAKVFVEPQAKPAQHQERCLVAGIVGAMAEMELCCAQPALGLPDQLPQSQGSRARRVSR